MDFDMVFSMSVEELKNYLRLRALRVTGSKQELVAKVFATIENGVKPVKSAVKIENDLNSVYTSKLTLDAVPFPDPYSISEGGLMRKMVLKFGQWYYIQIYSII